MLRIAHGDSEGGSKNSRHRNFRTPGSNLCLEQALKMFQNILMQKLRWPFDKHFGHDCFGVEPLDDGRIAQAFRVISQIMGNHCEYVKALVQLKGEGRVTQIAVDYMTDVVLGSNFTGILVVAAEARA